MGIFLGYVFLGLSLSAPIGPINAAQLDKGIRKGFLHAWVLGLGALMADVLYMLLVYMGVVHFLNTDFVKSFLWSFGTFVLFYTGIESLRGAGDIAIQKDKDHESVGKSFVSGFFMSISNPLTILFWLGIFGSVLAKTAATYSREMLLFYSMGIILGILIWDITMASVASSFRRFLTPRLLTGISILSGLSLIAYSLYFGYQAYQTIFGP